MSLQLFEEACERLGATTKRTEKESILREVFENTQTMELFRLAYDPYTMFGVLLPEESAGAQTASYDEVIAILQQLSSRQLTGNAAREAATKVIQSKYLRRLLKKDLNIGTGVTTINKVKPELIKEFKLLLADPIESTQSWEGLIHYLDDYKSWFIQPKLDGFRCITVIRDGKVSIFSRSGKPLYHTERIEAEILLHFDNIVLDSEILWCDNDGKMSFKKTSNIVTADTKEISEEDMGFLRLYIFDSIPLAEWDSKSFTTIFEKRYRAVQSVLINMPTVYLRLVDTQPLDLTNRKQIEKHIEQGYEGSILRYALSKYELKRGKWCLKWKQFLDCTLTIIGCYPGEPNSRNAHRLGGFYGKGVRIENPKLKLGYEIRPWVEGEEVDPEQIVLASSGGGFSDKQRDEFWEKRDSMPGQKMDVKYQEICKNATDPGWSLRFNPFRRIREDI